MEKVVTKLEECPIWNYDGSSTGQAVTDSSEIILKPCRVCKNPFRPNSLLVLCSTWNTDGTPAAGNFRYLAEKVFAQCGADDTWFGIEQEYILYAVKSVHFKYPIGWGKDGYNAPQGLYYCGVGAGHIYGREVAEDHLKLCKLAGLDIAGINAEVFPGQWEYQCGVCKGIDMCDQLWLTRFILQKVCEKYQMFADFRPKPEKGDWNGSGCHTNYSTKATRDKATGWDTFMKYCDAMKVNHLEVMKLFGTGNEGRMTGQHETADYNVFTYGIGARGCSVRIGNDAKKNGCGYMEDRRPSPNIDPYLSVSALADTTCNGGVNVDEMVKAFSGFLAAREFTFQE